MKQGLFVYLPLVLFLSNDTFGQPQVNPFIDDTVVQQISLTVDPADWATFLQNYEDNTYYKATFTWNGITENIGIRQHGGGSRSPIKPNIDLNFAHYTKTQTFLGVGFLILKANNEDPSNLHEWMSMKLFRRMGFPAPRESFATVSVNGTNLGFFMIVEHDDDAFLERNFGEDGGYFYEWQNQSDNYDFGNLGTDPTLYSPYLDLKTDQASPDLQTFANLVQVVNQPLSSSFSNAAFIAALEQYMDPQMFLTYAATENVVSESDGLVGGIIGMNNFNLYQYQGTTVYTLAPWDKDLTFYAFDRDIFAGFTNGANINVLAARLITIPGYQNIYLDRLNQVAKLMGSTGGWADQELTREYGVINTAASNDPNKQCLTNGVLYGCGTQDFQSGITAMRTFLQFRAPFVLSAIANAGYQIPTANPLIASVSSVGTTNITGMSPGALVQISGSQLGTSAQANQYPLARSLANTFVAIEGVRAPIVSTSPSQIEVQIPWDIPIGDAAVVVSANGTMSNSFDSTMRLAAPSILAATHADGTVISADHPANGGEAIVIYMTGLGAVDTEPNLGAATPTSPLTNAIVSPQVLLGSVPLTVLFSGLTPSIAGVYQVNVLLPQPLGQTGSVGLSFSTSGQTATIQLPLQ